MTYFLLLLLLLIVVYLSGPRIKLHADIRTIDLPDDLDHYLSDQESQVPLLLANTEKTIIWASPETKAKTEYAIVYLHGFSASRQEVAPLCDKLAHSLNANLFYTRLTGHGCDGQAMANITLSALLTDAQEALEIGKRLGNKVVLVGNSTGSTLATWLALNNSQGDIHSLILMSPNYGLKNAKSELLLLPWGSLVMKLLQGNTYQFEPANSHQAHYWTTSYPSQALLPMMALIKLVRRAKLEKISLPLLVLYSRHDQVVSVEKMLKAFERFGSKHKRLQEIDKPASGSWHVLAGDILSPDSTIEVAEKIQFFLKEIVSQGDS